MQAFSYNQVCSFITIILIKTKTKMFRFRHGLLILLPELDDDDDDVFFFDQYQSNI
jgi:hypothetical protein